MTPTRNRSKSVLPSAVDQTGGNVSHSEHDGFRHPVHGVEDAGLSQAVVAKVVALYSTRRRYEVLVSVEVDVHAAVNQFAK
jgi:hypothetical protein